MELDAVLEADEAANGLAQLNDEQAELVDGVLQDLEGHAEWRNTKVSGLLLRGASGKWQDNVL